jgi:hypothetical protein
MAYKVAWIHVSIVVAQRDIDTRFRSLWWASFEVHKFPFRIKAN